MLFVQMSAFFKDINKMCRHGQVVKTLASHAEIRGSTPLGDTKSKMDTGKVSIFAFIYKMK